MREYLFNRQVLQSTQLQLHFRATAIKHKYVAQRSLLIRPAVLQQPQEREGDQKRILTKREGRLFLSFAMLQEHEGTDVGRDIARANTVSVAVRQGLFLPRIDRVAQEDDGAASDAEIADARFEFGQKRWGEKLVEAVAVGTGHLASACCGWWSDVSGQSEGVSWRGAIVGFAG